jgi:hypothetical protein
VVFEPTWSHSLPCLFGQGNWVRNIYEDAIGGPSVQTANNDSFSFASNATFD